ncbi:TIGR03086 family protein [Nocardioides exalbidus]|uniref:TIGR03086 family protein n=1 Tax=Nocardioides exalbidus TaxID=402596 RepID=A0A1H4QDV8_9ACTN|nr:TIGR03086 family metal-binding protein [Nocardioides exalbidus]SEC17748.1 TIGR03086 family protein [Nocardioides exalbidus]
MTSPVDTLEKALDQAGRALDAVGANQLDNPSTCVGWTVRELASHVAASPGRFGQMARGEEVDWAADPGIADDDLASSFRSSADTFLAGLRELPEEQQGSAAVAVAEYAVHSWDLVASTGSDVMLDDAVAETALATMQEGLTDENRKGAFDPEVPLPDDATAYERLVAFAGRNPRAFPG